MEIKNKQTTELKIIYDIKKVMERPSQVKQQIHPQFYSDFNVPYHQRWNVTKYKYFLHFSGISALLE